MATDPSPTLAPLEVGAAAPEFALPGTGGVTVRLTEQGGAWVVLFFYSRDMTAVASRQAGGFREAHDRLIDAGAVVFGISPDPVGQHAKFVAKNELPYVLLADETKATAKAYGAWRLQSRAGCTFHGVAPTTYIIDPQGDVAAVFADAGADRHAADALAWLEARAGNSHTGD